MREWTVPLYTELKALGSGGFGDVVLARHDTTGTLVAIKYLRRDLLADPEFTVMFRAEATALASVADPNIVRLYEYAESPSGAAIVMELVDGVSLREVLARQGKTTAEAALVVLQGSLLGLAAAHRQGVVHRDYKPENVLINGEGTSKLTDFGIAARTGDRPVPAGTLTYAAPEQIAGAPATPASDVYAATATFYECLTGHPPFSGDTAEALLRQHQSDPVPLDPVPEPLRPLVAAGMAKEPGCRPADASTLVTQLAGIASAAYGPGWADRGRSHLGEAALLLALLWPSSAPPAVQGSAVEQVNLSQDSQSSRDARESRESRHLRHIRHLEHLRHLKHLRATMAVAAVAVVVAAGVAVAATGGPSHQSGGGAPRHAAVAAFPVSRAHIPVSRAHIPVTTTSGRPPVTGDVYVEYHGGKDASAQLSGQITSPADGEVARLYAQQFPFASPAVPAGSVTLHPAGTTASYAFQVTPTLATRYQVELFRDSTATTPLASSATSTIYVVPGGTDSEVHNCNRPVCHATFTWTFTVPPTALNTEISKQVYAYFAVNLSPSAEPEPPALLQLGAGDPLLTAAQRISADEYQQSVTFTIQAGNDAWHAAFNTCTKDTEAEDGIGLPGHHGCGDAQVPYPGGYLG
jgi:serine/threonine protein kinase